MSRGCDHEVTKGLMKQHIRVVNHSVFHLSLHTLHFSTIQVLKSVFSFIHRAEFYREPEADNTINM